VACPAAQYFSTLSKKRHDFRGKKAFEYKMCVLILSTAFVLNDFYSKTNRARYGEKCVGLQEKRPLFVSDFNGI